MTSPYTSVSQNHFSRRTSATMSSVTSVFTQISRSKHRTHYDMKRWGILSCLRSCDVHIFHCFNQGGRRRLKHSVISKTENVPSNSRSTDACGDTSGEKCPDASPTFQRPSCSPHSFAGSSMSDAIKNVMKVINHFTGNPLSHSLVPNDQIIKAVSEKVEPRSGGEMYVEVCHTIEHTCSKITPQPNTGIYPGKANVSCSMIESYHLTQAQAQRRVVEDVTNQASPSVCLSQTSRQQDICEYGQASSSREVTYSHMGPRKLCRRVRCCSTTEMVRRSRSARSLVSPVYKLNWLDDFSLKDKTNSSTSSSTYGSQSVDIRNGITSSEEEVVELLREALNEPSHSWVSNSHYSNERSESYEIREKNYIGPSLEEPKSKAVVSLPPREVVHNPPAIPRIPRSSLKSKRSFECRSYNIPHPRPRVRNSIVKRFPSKRPGTFRPAPLRRSRCQSSIRGKQTKSNQIQNDRVCSRKTKPDISESSSNVIIHQNQNGMVRSDSLTTRSWSASTHDRSMVNNCGSLERLGNDSQPLAHMLRENFSQYDVSVTDVNAGWHSGGGRYSKEYCESLTETKEPNTSSQITPGDSSLKTYGLIALAETSDLVGDASVRTIDKELGKFCFENSFECYPRRTVHCPINSLVEKRTDYQSRNCPPDWRTSVPNVLPRPSLPLLALPPQSGQIWSCGPSYSIVPGSSGPHQQPNYSQQYSSLRTAYPATTVMGSSPLWYYAMPLRTNRTYAPLPKARSGRRLYPNHSCCHYSRIPRLNV
ncbi:unnamed protein product [Calicophoron daubneyi]|uniref:Uncharacterized protein n=1 Tax=Calicophoron daubneyi TaxID=300641 RepID=A0AAV2T3K6_CALDB